MQFIDKSLLIQAAKDVARTSVNVSDFQQMMARDSGSSSTGDDVSVRERSTSEEDFFNVNVNERIQVYYYLRVWENVLLT